MSQLWLFQRKRIAGRIATTISFLEYLGQAVKLSTTSAVVSTNNRHLDFAWLFGASLGPLADDKPVFCSTAEPFPERLFSHRTYLWFGNKKLRQCSFPTARESIKPPSGRAATEGRSRRSVRMQHNSATV
jgi:hypothetical protein